MNTDYLMNLTPHRRVEGQGTPAKWNKINFISHVTTYPDLFFSVVNDYDEDDDNFV